MTAQLPLSSEVQRAKLTARDFWTLADSGAFEGFAKTELIEGEIWVVNAVHAWHAKTLISLGTELKLALRETGSDLVVYGSGSINLSDDSVPEPDLSIAEDHDGKGVPLAKVKLAVELSDTTLANDLGRKAALYAKAGIPEYWVVDRDGRRIVQMWAPTSEGYSEQHSIAFGERVTAIAMPTLTVDTAGF